VHHTPTGPSTTARLTALARRRATLLSGTTVCAVVAGIVLAVLFLSGGSLSGGSPPDDGTGAVDGPADTEPRAAELESGSVRLGVDGTPAAGVSPAGPADGTTSAASTPPGTASSGTTRAGTTSPGAGAGSLDTSAPGTTPSDAGGSTVPAGTGPGSTTPGTGTPDTGTPGTATPDPTVPDGPAPGGGSSPVPDAPATVDSVDSPVPVAAPSAPDEAQVLGLVNRERAANGCGAVVGDSGLAAVARSHSADMRDRGYFDHVDPSGQDPFRRAAAAGVTGARAENIAQGQGDAAAVMAAWMASPGHRANILDCSLTRLGVGVAEGPGGPWWTQLFGS
jgi:uncharacterized protein YkwD